MNKSIKKEERKIKKIVNNVTEEMKPYPTYEKEFEQHQSQIAV
jgi:hypothetical protein